MNYLDEQRSEDLVGILSLLILGLGLLALFTQWTSFPFWLIFVIGYGVIVPIVAILLNVDGSETNHWGCWDWCRGIKHRPRTEPNESRSNPHTPTERSVDRSASLASSTTDALSTLRERYARGDLTDEQFERKLDRLLETETPESAAEWRRRTTRDIESGTETERG